ncbi:MAG: response regulator [Pseudomonadota bacterium]
MTTTESIRLLVVEDQPLDAQQLIEELELYGLQVFWLRVDNNADLMAALCESWDAVICDFVVPGMRWENTLTVVRGKLADVPFIVVSGKRGEEYAVETLRAGCSDFVVKDRLMRLAPSVVRELERAKDTRALRVSQEQLQVELQRARRLEATGHLAAGLAHNLNNILTVIMGSLDLARYEQGGETDNGYLRDAMRATERASKLTRQLNQLAAGPSFEPAAVDLNDMLAHLEMLVRPGLPERIALEVTHGTDLPIMVVDPVMLEQAVLNLILNARDAIDGNGKISCGVRIDDGRWIITVEDTGHGIPYDMQERVFEPFFSTKGDAGTGLGLSTTYQIMKNHDGNASLFSVPGQGSRFELSAPVKTAKAPVASDYFNALREGHGRVLVVDDTEEILLTSRAILKQCGYQVDAANGFTPAIESLAGDVRPDVIITDSVMAEGGAADILQWLNRRHIEIPIIVTSAFATDEQHRYSTKHGFAGFLPKPFNADRLSAMVAAVREPAPQN